MKFIYVILEIYLIIRGLEFARNVNLLIITFSNRAQFSLRKFPTKWYFTINSGFYNKDILILRTIFNMTLQEIFMIIMRRIAEYHFLNNSN